MSESKSASADQIALPLESGSQSASADQSLLPDMSGSSEKALKREYDTVVRTHIDCTLEVMFHRQKIMKKAEEVGASLTKTGVEVAHRLLEEHDNERAKAAQHQKNVASAIKNELEKRERDKEAVRRAREENRKRALEACRAAEDAEADRMIADMKLNHPDQFERRCYTHRRCKPGQCISSDPPRCSR